ncbi:MAG: FAD-dependent thymidylate synthase [Candidatus Altiarchaeum hamiconexum]|uniref:Flavin-dependent thymidylate synthase n=1 Tax=Candidatus Altarchaeum hamiconexum TaxID=1803513 RepID=A0A8J8CF17_9ARCH|nr:FAD-dependent thymidylate synthase [Candidatus Altarchaeum hamiconexum]OIQ05260.1 MAG: thymidylate synthase, flavin-dependent [Candidatus Altarchaeum sp. CG2_30_32_3053]PIN68080.1 MAG: thymidylate synthase (FAD) [Candidatus Altarchaeum sp. CG12_big_fil_rev_8_21_14_0_65_33_22]PIV28371.1 MAG: thymidylate synthase (FAD) [Candidatus Altarchaeum sp. CG03_land_8_20_14_0_80_32_618]PIZ32213.1 MAG: thymidylate synthase (FAD) [Candidatus Altarchaeum sp. CG_4_10_14_0_8_um_filter_32_851]
MKVELLSITPNAEKLIEYAGRTAYLSFGKQKRGSEKEFIKMIIKHGHLSVLEHASASFRINGGSRAFTHQLVRHRLSSFTQQSQRYVNESNFIYIEPDSVKNNTKTHTLFVKFMDDAKKTYLELQKLGIKKEDARFVLPNAVESQIVVTANLREWRHIIELRSSFNAQWEIKSITIQILKILKKHASTVFEDFEIDEQNNIIKKKEL